MAPDKRIDHSALEGQIKDIIQDLFQLMVQTSAYDTVGPNLKSRDILTNTINQLHADLVTLYAASNTPFATQVQLPPEILTYVDQGRNPDIYTREFVELARRGNQILKGKSEAFASFRDVLAREMGTAMPEWSGDIAAVVEKVGGGGGGRLGVMEGDVMVKKEG